MSTPRLLLIGGVGGSGTRVVTQIINALGVYIGSNLNAAFDNLDWPGNAKLLRDPSKSGEEKLEGLAAGFQPFAQQMLRGAEKSGGTGTFWATKVPGSFYYLPYLAQLFDHLHYIHVIRHGLDMAFSHNKNQFYNWGSFFDITPTDDALPNYQLKYWARANTYALEQCKAWLQKRHLLIRFEDLCSQKENSILQITDFLEKDPPHAHIGDLTALIRPPKTIGRYKQKGRLDMFDLADIETVKVFGYDVEWP